MARTTSDGRAPPGKGQRDAEQIVEPAADGAVAPKQDQQHVADDHRRQDQRQVDQPVQQGAPGKAAAGQKPGGENGERQAPDHRPERNAQGKADGFRFRGAQQGGEPFAHGMRTSKP